MGLFCLDMWALAGSVDLDWALRDKASDLDPPSSLLVWDVKYMQVVNLFYSIIDLCRPWLCCMVCMT